MRKVELLAPAGSFDALRAAIENGADAVYLAGRRFGARKSATNFSEAELCEAVRLAHLWRVKVYVTVNTLVADEEGEELVAWLRTIDGMGVDAAIIQDLGVLEVAREMVPSLPLHASTQMSIQDPDGARLVKEWGLTRAILARELSLAQIKAIHAAVPDLDLEVFAQGAMCYGVSGQCLLSSLLGGRSGNRGECAQPCRHPYTLRVGGRPLKGYPLSMRDLNTLSILPQLAETGIGAVKIEGRLKRPEYVALAVRLYREALDGKEISTERIAELAQLFNRGFGTGHLAGQRTGREEAERLISFEAPGHQGLLFGKVKKSNPGWVELDRTPDQGDELRIGEKVFLAERVEGNRIHSWSLREQVFEPGQAAYRLQSTELTERIRASAVEKKIPLKVEARGEEGKPLVLRFEDPEGNAATVETPTALEPARKLPLDEPRLFTQLDRLGDTPYRLDRLSLDRADLTVPLSAINAARREAVEQLTRARLEHYPRPKPGTPKRPARPAASLGGGLFVHLRGHAACEAALEAGADGIYVDADDPETSGILNAVQKAGKLLLSRPSPFGWNETEGAILASNVGQLEPIARKGPIVTDYSIPCFNREAAEFLKREGVARATLSVELNRAQIFALMAAAPLPFELIVHGRYPLLISRHCIGKGECGGTCPSLELVDRLGLSLPLRRDGACRLMLYNPKELCLVEALETLSPIAAFRLELALDSPEKVRTVTRIYREALDGGVRSGMKERLAALSDQGLTQGHWERGVLGSLQQNERQAGPYRAG